MRPIGAKNRILIRLIKSQENWFISETITFETWGTHVHHWNRKFKPICFWHAYIIIAHKAKLRLSVFYSFAVRNSEKINWSFNIAEKLSTYESVYCNLGRQTWDRSAEQAQVAKLENCLRKYLGWARRTELRQKEKLFDNLTQPKVKEILTIISSSQEIQLGPELFSVL